MVFIICPIYRPDNQIKVQTTVSSAPQVSAVFSIAQNKPNITTNPMQPAINRFTIPQQRPIMPNTNMNMQNMAGPQQTPMVMRAVRITKSKDFLFIHSLKKRTILNGIRFFNCSQLFYFENSNNSKRCACKF